MEPFLHTEDQDVLKSYCDFFNYNVYFNIEGEFAALDQEDVGWWSLYVNYAEIHRQGDGMFNWNDIVYLENHFQFPLFPTKEEKVLFLIEHGVEYPLKTLGERLGELDEKVA